MASRILIIGGTRNLGHSLAMNLLDRGYHVTILNRGVTRDDLPSRVERLRADRRDSEAVRNALGPLTFDAVVDTALYNGGEAEAAVRLLENRIGKYVFISTGQVYLVRQGVSRPFREPDYDGVLLSEPAAGSEDHKDWLYGIEKRQAEDVFRAAWRERKFPFISLRLPMVNSERDHYHRIHNYLSRLGDGGPIVVPAGSRLALRHVYGGDVVNAIIQVLETGSGIGEAFNLAQEETVTLEDFLGMLAGQHRIVEVDPHILRERGLMPACSPFSDPWMSALDNSRSKEVLKIGYTPLAEYLDRLVRHYRNAPPPPGYAQRPEELSATPL